MNDSKRILALFLLITLGLDLAVAQVSAPSRKAATAASLRKIDRDLTLDLLEHRRYLFGSLR